MAAETSQKDVQPKVCKEKKQREVVMLGGNVILRGVGSSAKQLFTLCSLH